MKTINPTIPNVDSVLALQMQAVLNTLDKLAVALANHDHKWTESERLQYEKAVRIVKDLLPLPPLNCTHCMIEFDELGCCYQYGSTECRDAVRRGVL